MHVGKPESIKALNISIRRSVDDIKMGPEEVCVGVYWIRLI
jgi:hypothetical protein